MSSVNNPIQHTAGDKHAPGTFVQYKNGAVAQVQDNGRFKIVAMPPAAREMAKANLARARSKGRYSKKMSKMAAARAFNKYYKGKAYKSEKARKAAMTRDMCHNKSHMMRDTSAYRANPGRFDYKGVDDGSRCPKGRKVYQHVTRDMSAVRAKRGQRGGRQSQRQQQQQQQQQKQQQQQQEQEQWEQEWEEERERQQQQQKKRRQRQQRQRRSRNNRQ